jgi:ribose 5-phosphate isomerase A
MVESGLVVGLGSGSTARFATLRIAERLRDGELTDIVGVPTSEDTARLARRGGIPLAGPEDWRHIDMTIDGADEVDPRLNVTKGRGGYLLREKIVAYGTDYQVIVVDDSKLVDRLGTRAAIGVEVVRFGWRLAHDALERLGATVQLREADGRPLITDEGNYVLDCRYTEIGDPYRLAAKIEAIPGVVEHGLFLDLVRAVVVGAPEGARLLER